jgi:hypothetical protein
VQAKMLTGEVREKVGGPRRLPVNGARRAISEKPYRYSFFEAAAREIPYR